MTNINKDFLTAIGNRLRELRKNKKLTQVQLSEVLSNKYYVDISDKSISRYENGESLLETEKLISLAEFFETSTEYILYGRKTGDEESFTWYDTFKRLNRLIYPLAVGIGQADSDGKIYLQLWDDEMKLYYSRLQSFGIDKRYVFENKAGDPQFDVTDMDALFVDFKNDREQLAPTLERYNKYLKSQGIDPEMFLKHRIDEIRSKREN
ncbi:MAG: helix-turn-helix transcriptional regulator [Clostridia bacterium]|nr:helix-turn-helix transcriptional regulator [Clostridia bacterium]